MTRKASPGRGDDAPRTQQYGVHLTLDGYDGNPAKLNDLALIFNVLDALPPKIDMTKIGFPQLIRITEPDIAGISGFVFVLESHISVHTYPYKGFLSMDTYSCKPFDTEQVIREFVETFELQEVETHVLPRGTKFPADNLWEPGEFDGERAGRRADD